MRSFVTDRFANCASCQAALRRSGPADLSVTLGRCVSSLRAEALTLPVIVSCPLNAALIVGQALGRTLRADARKMMLRRIRAQ